MMKVKKITFIYWVSLLFFYLNQHSIAYAFDAGDPSIAELIGGNAYEIQQAIFQSRQSSKVISKKIYSSRRGYWKCENSCEDEYKMFRLALLEKDILYAYLVKADRSVPGGLQAHEVAIINLAMGDIDGGIIKSCQSLHLTWAKCYTDKRRKPGDDYLAKCMPSYQPYEQCVMEYEIDNRLISHKEYSDPISSLVANLKRSGDTWSQAENDRVGSYFDYFDLDTIHKAAIVIWMAPGAVPKDPRYAYDKHIYMNSEYKDKLGCDRMRRVHCWRQVMSSMRKGKLTPTAERLLSSYMIEHAEQYKENRARLEKIYRKVTQLYGQPKY